MSAVRCSECDQIFSSDDDPACFVEKPDYVNTAMPLNVPKGYRPEYVVVCEACRDRWQEESDQMNEWMLETRQT